jgi:DNA-binding LytR/AlgR family response regulator
MKCTVIIDDGREEEVIIYAKKMTDEILEISEMINKNKSELVGYNQQETVVLPHGDIICVFVEDGRVNAMTERGIYRLRERLYTLEGELGASFVKINQSCIANTKAIEKFETSIGGSLRVVFKNGHSDYISRRQLKVVKNKFGI